MDARGATEGPSVAPADGAGVAARPEWMPEVKKVGWETAAQLAPKVEREKRVVLKWLEDIQAQWPAAVTVKAGKQGVKLCQLEIVKAYMASRALEGSEAAAPVAVELVPGKDGDAEGDSPLFRARLLEEVEREMQLRTGFVDFAGMKGKARRAFDELLQSVPHELSTVAIKEKWTAAVERCGRILVSLDEAAFEAEKRNGQWIERDRAVQMLVSLSALFASDGKSLAVEVPRAVIAAIAEMVDPARMDEARRLANAAGRVQWDKVAKRLADKVRAEVAKKAEKSDGK